MPYTPLSRLVKFCCRSLLYICLSSLPVSPDANNSFLSLVALFVDVVFPLIQSPLQIRSSRLPFCRLRIFPLCPLLSPLATTSCSVPITLSPLRHLRSKELQGKQSARPLRRELQMMMELPRRLLPKPPRRSGCPPRRQRRRRQLLCRRLLRKKRL
jgi:hypothetical protein